MSGFENIRAEASHQPGEGEVFPNPPPDTIGPRTGMESEDIRKELAQIERWWVTARDAHAENRLEQQTDCDFYDNLQWKPDDAAAIEARGQAPAVYNKIAMTVNWLIGTERRTRVDYAVHPRTAEDLEPAQHKKAILKYLQDVNRSAWARSAAFTDAVKCGVGWTTEIATSDPDDEIILQGYVPWREMWWDPFARDPVMKDARFVVRRRFVDVDYAQAMFPERKREIESAATDMIYPEDEGAEDLDMPLVYRTIDKYGRLSHSRRISGGGFADKGARLRVAIYEMWYRKPVKTQRISGAGFGGWYDPHDDAAQQAVQAGLASLTDAVRTQMHFAFFIPGHMLSTGPSPYKHNRYPFTPVWATRRDRDGMPYGIIRGARDAQEALNKRMSKALWVLSSNQLIYEEAAIDEADEDQVLDEIAKPNGVIRLNDGGLQKIRIERGGQLSQQHVDLAQFDAAHIHDATGVNRENLGRDSNATSGRAIIAKQQEGAVTTAELFDNYRLAFQESGSKLLALTEQFMTAARQFRITQEPGAEASNFLKVNELVQDPATGEWQVLNDIAASEADFVVDQSDFRETMRLLLADQLMTMITKLPPELAIKLIDLPVALMDLPQRDEIIRRIQQVNGMGTVDPAAEAAQAEQRALEMRGALAKITKDEATTEKLRAEASGKKIDTKGRALGVAGALAAAIPIAPAADRLLSDDPNAQAGNPAPPL